MGWSFGGGHGPKQPVIPKPVRVCSAPAGSLPAFRLPASSGNSLTVAAMLTTSQCQNPPPVGASGSKQ
jgi:hypothetical protein